MKMLELMKPGVFPELKVYVENKVARSLSYSYGLEPLVTDILQHLLATFIVFDLPTVCLLLHYTKNNNQIDDLISGRRSSACLYLTD